MVEIERKFLVTNNSFLDEYKEVFYIAQGYLCDEPRRTVRIRIKNEKGYITIKGTSNKSGTTRFEWEKEITLGEAKQLLKLCNMGIIEKNRYVIPFNNHFFEVDVFEGENKGLLLAEVELQNENEVFEKPHWLGKEVTGDKRYYNSYLSKYPFSNW